MILVVPPAKPAAVPVKKSSAATVPMKGSCMWVCGSMPPGITYCPPASIVCAPAGASRSSPTCDDLAVDAQHVGAELAVGVDDGAAADQQAGHGADLLHVGVLPPLYLRQAAACRIGLFGCVVQSAAWAGTAWPVRASISPGASVRSVMHSGTGQTVTHRLQPTHSSSITSKWRSPFFSCGDRLVRGVFAGDVAAPARDALVLVDHRLADRVEVQVLPVGDRLQRPALEIGRGRETLVVHVVRQARRSCPPRS